MANAPQGTIGKFRIIATLGGGSQGAVYRARDMWLGREVALKVLHPHLATPDLVERFRREARIIASVPHPNIAGVSEIGEHDGFHCIAIEYIPHSLAELMARGALDVNLAVSIAYQTALALEAARTSESAITHHDVKPDNILLTSLDVNPIVKLIDFGIAHAEGMTSITQTGSQWGTPLYMPPEQWAGERGDTRSDIYSLGVVLYHALAGRPPFNSDAANNVAKQTEIARQHQQTAAPPLRSMRGDVSEALDAIVAKCMAKQPSARYQTPGELANELAGMLGQVAPPAASVPPVQARQQSSARPLAAEPRPSPSFVKPNSKPRNRMRMIAAASLGAIIAITLIALMVYQPGDSALDLPPRIAAVVAPANTPTGVSISAGSRHACALRESGAAVCWGDNRKGQADPSTAPIVRSESQAGSRAVPFTAISAGGSHTCGLRENGEAECWGGAPLSGSFVAISAGGRHTCALRKNGAAECRGWNKYGQTASPSGSFIAISAGYDHTCALRENGAAECWGSNTSGQADPPSGSFIAISAGRWHTCALRKNGAAACWGRNTSGQADPPSGSFIAISAGRNHTCALREDGAVVCWGRNNEGQSDPPAESFAAISAGGFHTCALREDGAAECWGWNEYGQTDSPAGSFAR